MEENQTELAMKAPPRTPYATLILAAIITIIQGIRMLGGSSGDTVYDSLVVPSWEALYGQPWRILTSPFLHQNVLHYLENLFFLLLFGWQIERKQGWKIFLIAFLGGLITGYVIWINLAHEFLIGISGGICGLFGFSLISNRQRPWWKTLTHVPLNLLYTLNLMWAVIVDVTNLIPFSVAHLNHLIGIVYGILLVITLVPGFLKRGWHIFIVTTPLLLFASQLYSPWQVERRLLTQQPALETPDADCRLTSLDQETYTPALITVLNNSDQPIAVYWLDYEGQPKFQFWMRDGDAREWNTFVGHPWCIIDPDNLEALEAVIVTEDGQIIDVR
jgi:membrane associated rhomboid family serine protease